jgi:hypothetical protein
MIPYDSLSLITVDPVMDVMPFWLVSEPFNFLSDADNRPGLVITALWVLNLIGAAVPRLDKSLSILKSFVAGNELE